MAKSPPEVDLGSSTSSQEDNYVSLWRAKAKSVKTIEDIIYLMEIQKLHDSRDFETLKSLLNNQTSHTRQISSEEFMEKLKGEVKEAETQESTRNNESVPTVHQILLQQISIRYGGFGLPEHIQLLHQLSKTVTAARVVNRNENGNGDVQIGPVYDHIFKLFDRSEEEEEEKYRELKESVINLAKHKIAKALFTLVFGSWGWMIETVAGKISAIISVLICVLLLIGIWKEKVYLYWPYIVIEILFTIWAIFNITDIITVLKEGYDSQIAFLFDQENLYSIELLTNMEIQIPIEHRQVIVQGIITFLLLWTIKKILDRIIKIIRVFQLYRLSNY